MRKMALSAAPRLFAVDTHILVFALTGEVTAHPKIAVAA